MPNYNSVESFVRDRIKQFIESERLFSEGDRILVGYSGGGDSTCLLHLLHSLGFDCVAAYLHHGQREEADSEMLACEQFAMSLGIPFVSGRADVPALARDMKIGLEEAGREARYDFFARASRQMNCEAVATGHTLSDQVETILLNLARGSGMKGLRGMPVRREKIVRPLLRVRREETLGYCHAHGLSFFTDPANHDLTFSRSRIRAHVIPELTKVNHAFAANLIRMSELVQEEDNFLDGMAAAALEQSEYVPNPDLAFLTRHLEFLVNRIKICSLPPVLFNRAIRLGVKSLGGQLETRHSQDIEAQIKNQKSGSITSPLGSILVSWDERNLHFTRPEPIMPFRSSVQIGILESDELGWKLSAKTMAGSGRPGSRRTLSVELPVGNLRLPLHVRNLQPGDRMTPLGFSSKRKLSDLVSEARVTREARARLPVLCDLAGPIWVPGVCLDARMSQNLGSGQVMLISFGPL